MNAYLTVLRKELVDSWRDRRSVASALIWGPVIGPLLMAGLIWFVADRAQERQQRPLEIPVIGAEHAPNLIAFLKQQGVQIKPAPNDPEALIRSQDEDVIVRIDARYAQAFVAGKPAPVELLNDSSRQQAQATVERVRALLDGYGNQIGRLRLTVRGIDASIVNAVAVVDRDLATPSQRASLILGFVPYLVFMTLFVGGMYLASDTTAGERERQSLEPLLITPVPRGQLVLGKISATALYALAALTIEILVIALLVALAPIERLGMANVLNGPNILAIFVLSAPLAILAAAGMTLVSAFANSYREAQTYLGMMILIPMLPTLILAVNPVKPELWMYLTPLVSQNIQIIELLREEPVSLAMAISGATITLSLAAVLVYATTRLYRREKLAIAS